jgi:hypothetical protein
MGSRLIIYPYKVTLTLFKPVPKLKSERWVSQFLLVSAGIVKQSMGARNRVGIGLSYRLARLHCLPVMVPWNRFLRTLEVKKFGLRLLSSFLWFKLNRPNYSLISFSPQFTDLFLHVMMLPMLTGASSTSCPFSDGHRVGRVLSFFSSRRNWNSPTPLTAGDCAPDPLFRGGGAHSLAGEGLGDSHNRRGDIHCGAPYI